MKLTNLLLEMANEILNDRNLTVNINSNLFEIMDSLDAVEFIMKIEKEFDIQIPDEDAERITYGNKTIKDIKNELKIYGIIDIQEERKNKIINIEKSI